jgi:hypothetical protein
LSAPQPVHVPLPPLTFWQGLRYCHDPRLVAFHFRQVRQAERLLIHLTDASLEAVREAMREIWRDMAFLRDLLGRYAAIIGRQPRGTDFMFLAYQAGSLYFHGLIQYALVRLLRPAVVVETGGTPGNSSAFMLRALDRNGHGELHTIDLPPAAPLGDYTGCGSWLHEGLPEGQQSGWAVPDDLRGRHRQHLGDAKVLLPQVLEAVQQVDVFIHDSDHSYAHMSWEFATAWPAIVPGGALLSDDIAANTAFAEFAAAQGLPPLRAGALGALRKPR